MCWYKSFYQDGVPLKYIFNFTTWDLASGVTGMRGAAARALLAAFALAAVPSSAPVPQAGADIAAESMQEAIDRLLTGYNKDTNPTYAIAERATASGACPDPAPGPNKVETQIYVSRLSGLDQVAGSYDIEGFFRLWWHGTRARGQRARGRAGGGVRWRGSAGRLTWRPRARARTSDQRGAWRSTKPAFRSSSS